MPAQVARADHSATFREGRWFSGGRHRTTQKCVERVSVEVNTVVPNQPGRR